MQRDSIITHIYNWLENYSKESKTQGFVVGVSGGIDSAVTSTLVAKTGISVLCVEMPIHQQKSQVTRGANHIQWLEKKFKNVTSIRIDLTSTFDNFITTLERKKESIEIARANTRARLRMTTLYYLAQTNNYLVVGTGNKVEDFGIGFFTKYGDGGVDINPISDLFKTEVYKIGEALNINNEILNAPPTDGLWEDDKTDEEQIGATYSEIEWAMKYDDQQNVTNKPNKREKEVLNIFRKFNKMNQHKMQSIPFCKIPDHLK